MKTSFLFFCFFLLSFFPLFAAGPEKFDWESERKRYTVGEEDLKSPAVVLKDKRVVEYIFDEKDELVEYKTIHKIILVNADDAIDKYNKVVIPIEDSKSLQSIKARSINKAGKITVIDKDALKEIKSGENLSFYKIFAIEGLEVGSEIEYIYTVKKSLNLFGREYLQGDNPSRNVSIEIISPENLEFEAKGYNDLPEFKSNVSDEKEKRFLVLSVDSIPGAVEEEYAVSDANLKRVDYKLAFNHAKGKSRIYTWSDAAQRIFSNICVFNKSELAKVKKLCKSQKFYSQANEEATIRAVENYVKSNFMLRKGNSEDYVKIDMIIGNKYGNESGLLKLFEAIYTELNIDHRLVLTSDRSECKFDGKFDTWNYLENYIIYFPGTGKYMAPTVMEMRYGMIPFYWTNNEGLFIKRVKIGDTETSVSEVKFIPALSGDKSMDNIYATITFSEDLDNVNVHAMRKFGGYNAIAFQPYYKMLDAEKQGELNDNLMQFISKDADISNIKVENIDPNQSLIEYPFIIQGDMKVPSLLEKAGTKYFFKVGDVIGRQSELYSEKKRVSPVENDFNRVYIRQIKVKIPQGYTFKNLDDLKINVTHEENGEKLMGFVSDYKVEGDTLVIDINEYYNKIDFPVSMYEKFRKVINAAADFNKIVLIMDKAQ